MENNSIVSNEEKLELSSKESDTTLKLRIKNFPDEKSYSVFIKQVERMIRASSEMRLWCDYIKNVLGYKYCSITLEDTEDVTIEIHHYITLYDIVSMVIDTKIMKDEEFSSFDIAEEVIELHYKNQVGYIPLATTMHEKVHSGSLKIPKNMIFGNWKKLVETYYVNEDIQHRINTLISIKPEEMISTWKSGDYPGAPAPKVGLEVEDENSGHKASIENSN